MKEVQAYPLQWPFGWPRTEAVDRRAGPFQVSRDTAVREMYDELEKLDASNVTISSNIRLRLDGTPFREEMKRYQEDPGIAVYFELYGRTQVIACDSYGQVHHNIRGIGLTVKALRAIDRYGSSELLERAFTGFTALPAASSAEEWWKALGVLPTASPDEIRRAYKAKALEAHPDTGGSSDAMAALTRARDEGLKS